VRTVLEGAKAQSPAARVFRWWRLGLAAAWLTAAFVVAEPSIPAPPPSEVRVVLLLDFVVPGGGPVKGALRFRQAGNEGAERRIAIAGSGPVTAALHPQTSWEIAGELPGYWVRRETLTVGTTAQPLTLRLRLWPLGRIAGTVRVVERGATPPKEVIVTTLAPHGFSGSNPPPKGSLVCPVSRDGRWSCELPAARFDLVITAKGFVPLYRFGVEVAPARSASAGLYELRRGASVAGWVEVGDGVVDPRHCRVRLTPLVVMGGAPAAERVWRTTLEVAVNERGFFQLAGVRPGTYALSVEQPGFSPARVSPVSVATDDETVLREALVLRLPFAIEVAVDPPTDWRGRPWRVQLFRSRDAASRSQGERVYEGVATPEGIALATGQEPGIFSLRVGDSSGNWLVSEDNLSFAGAEKVRHAVSIRLVSLRGTLAVGREPLAGELWFGGRHGKAAVKMVADARGKFSGFLAREGMWDLEVVADEGRVQSLQRVQVEVDSKGRARLEVQLPATRLYGRVVFEEDGRPAPGATVALIASTRNSVETTADDQGAFEFRGTAEGPVELAAALLEQSRFSDRVAVSATSDQPVGPVELRLLHTKTVAGRVGSPRGPVVGGSVDVMVFRPTLFVARPAATDLEGGFTTTVPAKAEAARIIVSAPGNGLKAFEVPLDQGEVYLEVSPDAGTLEIELGMAIEELDRKALVLALYQGSTNLPMPVLFRWARVNGASPMPAKGTPVITLPALAPGSYQVCLAPLAALGSTVTVTAQGPRETCQQGLLGAGSVLRLKVGR
jgi:hypothetical protein